MDPEFVRKFSFSANVHACSTNTVSDLYELHREHNSHFHLQKPTFFLLYTKPGICFHPKDSALTPNLPLKEKKNTASRVPAQTGNTIPRVALLGFVLGSFQDATGQIPEQLAENSGVDLL